MFCVVYFIVFFSMHFNTVNPFTVFYEVQLLVNMLNPTQVLRPH